jgi:hypothetical protein
VRRNPNYGGPRPRHFAAILYEMAVQLPAGVDRVARGRAELVAGFGDALLPRSSAARRFGPSAADGGPRWSRRTLAATHLLRMRTDAGPLADTRLRRAVALALDRNSMAAVFADAPTAHLLPPGVAGSVTAAVPQPDLTRARVLVGNRSVTLVFAGCRARPACQTLGSLVRTSLSRIGIAVRVRPAARHADLTLQEATMTTPDPLGFLAQAGGPRPPSPRPAPAQAATLARRLDAQLTRNGDAFAFGTPTIGELASHASVAARSRRSRLAMTSPPSVRGTQTRSRPHPAANFPGCGHAQSPSWGCERAHEHREDRRLGRPALVRREARATLAFPGRSGSLRAIDP